jgi:serine phosphatase RsbU (regulator of sigma subunit)
VLGGVDPDSVLPTMHSVLVSERASDEVFATVSMVRLDKARRTARFWQAGHPLPVLLDGAVTPVPDEAAGLALGIVDDMTWPGFDLDLAGSRRLMLFTDGLIEGYDGLGEGQRLGQKGMQEVLLELMSSGLAAAALADALLAEVQRRNGGELTDDVAVVLLSWTDPA